MPFAFRVIACAALGLLGLASRSPAAEVELDALPAEPTQGTWIEDTLDDGSLWFAASENLSFEAIAAELTDYPVGRRWVRVVDGKPAWVMYYVPGEILGFEVDTHHFGAGATEFRFAAGSSWQSLQPIDVDFEEIVAFEAKWLRLYRSVNALPHGARFLRIEFPQGAEIEAARLTEVWLRCRFEDADTAPAPDALAHPADNRVAVPPADDAIAANTPADAETWGEPFVVKAFVYHPDPPPPPEFPPVEMEAAAPVVVLRLPAALEQLDVIGELARLLEPPPAPADPEKARPLLARIVDFVRERVLR